MNAYEDHNADAEIDWRPPKTWVPATPPGARQSIQPIPERIDLVPVDVADVWRPGSPIAERTDARDRAWGLLIRQLPLAAVWLILAVAAALAAWQFASISGPAAALFGLVIFGGSCAATFIAFDRQERDYSGAGLERHRINQAASLKRLELKQMFELKRLVLERYLDHLDRKDGA